MEKLILLSSSRSGTNYFLDIFSKALPNSLVLKEIFRKSGDNLDILSGIFEVSTDQIMRYFNKKPVESWEDLINFVSNDFEYLIAKLFYYHIDNPSFFLRHISEDHTIVHLIRKNIFNTYISLKIALQTNKWQSFTISDNNNIELIIDRNELLKFISERTKEINKFRNNYVYKNYHELYYEDISKNPSQCISAISKILKTNIFRNVSPEIKKQKVDSNMTIIKNYQDIADLDAEIDFEYYYS